jgi:MYXO-CTERM domain-containing protein
MLHPQVFLYDTDTEELEQLTFEHTTKYGAFMWRAPEYGGEYVFFTIADRTQVRIYRKNKDTGKWAVSAAIDAPETVPYIWSPEPFVYNGKSYVQMQVSSSKKANDMTVPTQLAMTAILPDSQFRMLTNDNSIRRIRMDPEHFITEHGAFIYYNRYVPGVEGSHDVIDEGVWRVDTRLGPPRGAQQDDDAGMPDAGTLDDAGTPDAGSMAPPDDDDMDEAPTDDGGTPDADSKPGSCGCTVAPSRSHLGMTGLFGLALLLRVRRRRLSARQS